MLSTSKTMPALPRIFSAWGYAPSAKNLQDALELAFSHISLTLAKFDGQVIVYMLVSGGREPFWDGSDIRAIKNTLKKEVAINSVSLF